MKDKKVVIANALEEREPSNVKPKGLLNLYLRLNVAGDLLLYSLKELDYLSALETFSEEQSKACMEAVIENLFPLLGVLDDAAYRFKVHPEEDVKPTE